MLLRKEDYAEILATVAFAVAPDCVMVSSRGRATRVDKEYDGQMNVGRPFFTMEIMPAFFIVIPVMAYLCFYGSFVH